MAEACCIDFNGVRYIFQNNEDEEPERFVKRCWVWVKNINTFPEKKMRDMVSHAWANTVYKGVKYDEKMTLLIKKLVI